MFKLLKEKLTGWFKGKKEEQETEKKQKLTTEKEVKREKKEEKRKEKTKKAEEKKKKYEEKKEEIEEEKIEEKTQEEKKEIEVQEKSELKEEEKLEEEEGEEGNFFSKLIKKISSSKLEKEDFDELFMEFELVLLENNVALEVVDKIKESLAKELIGKQFKRAEVEKKILDVLKNSVDNILIGQDNLIGQIKQKEGVFVILFFGINGSGKTTTIAKLAYKLEKEGLSCVLAAGDTFRAASIEQLQEHARRLDIPIVKHDYKSDPAAVGYDAIQYAKKNYKKVVLIDTAGRMYTKTNLMKEMEKIGRVTKPDLKLFVGESITGNDAIEQAKTFNDVVGIDGIILTKADVDEKAGTILSVSYVTKKPIFYLGIGQNYEDLQEFKKENVLKGLGLE